MSTPLYEITKFSVNDAYKQDPRTFDGFLDTVGSLPSVTECVPSIHITCATSPWDG